MKLHSKMTLFSGLLIFSLSGTAQEVISSQGDTYSNGSATIDFTVGEVVINTVSNGSNDLTQGFHQTKWDFVGIENHAIDFSVNVYPNPTSDFITIETTLFEGVNYQLFDSKGKLVVNGELLNELTTIEVNQIAPGSFRLELVAAEAIKLKTFKLIKHQ